MALPTRDQLNAEVDRQFHEGYPQAPEQLDPNDPEQASWVEAWTSLRDQTVNAWTDSVFYSFFPNAGRLDPGNPDDAQLIEYWTDIRDQIRDGAPGRFSWDGASPAAAQTDQTSGDAPAAQPSGDTPAAQSSGDEAGGSASPTPDSAGGGQPDIEFETVDSPRWPQVKEGAHGIARDRIQRRYDAVVQGAQLFRDDADTLVKNSITKPPGELPGFGNFISAAMGCVLLVVPEVGLAVEILEAAHASYEVVKAGWELNEKVNQQVVANSVEEARSYLQELTKDSAEGVAAKALQVVQDVQNAVGPALDSYITQNPQPLQPGDDDFYKSLSDGIGIKEPDLEAVKMDVWNTVFPPFQKQVLVAAARIHFFQELDDDVKRLDFLIDEKEKGNDPDALLDLLGGDRAYWDHYLQIYQTDGRQAAEMQLAMMK